MNSGNRVILNTGFLYANMAVSLCVQLISVRILLDALGVVDYGIYNVVAGIVALMAFMNVAMAASTQRFLSYAIGEGNAEKQRELFYQSVVLHLGIGLLFMLVMETGGLYYVHHILQAPIERIPAASILLHCIAASTFVNIITVPYEAIINANEDMGAIALINIFDALLKLGTAIFVLYTAGDKLIIFGVLTMCGLIVTLTLKRVYCLWKYAEARIRWHRIHDYAQMRALVSFAGWNLIGTSCSMARFQGTAMILNAFFGIVINAAYGVAQQVNALLVFFANTIVRAIRPQVVKSEGAGERSRMLRLSVTTCKITALMVAFMAVPLFVGMPFVLEVWLHKQPDMECIMFCRCFLVIVFINQLTIGLQIAIESTGNIRWLQSIVGCMHIIALPLGWFCFQAGYPPVSIMLCIITEEVLALFMRVAIAHRQINLDAHQFIIKEISPCLFTVFTITLLCLFLSNHFLTVFPWIHVLVTVCVSTTLLSILGYCFLLNESERKAICTFIDSALTRLHLKP